MAAEAVVSVVTTGAPESTPMKDLVRELNISVCSTQAIQPALRVKDG